MDIERILISAFMILTLILILLNHFRIRHLEFYNEQLLVRVLKLTGEIDEKDIDQE